MKLFSVKKYLNSSVLVLFSLLSCASMHAAAIKLIQGFPYKPLWDLAVVTKKQGIQHVSNALIKPPVIYYAVPGAVAYGVWTYCELALWKLEKQRKALERDMDAAFARPVAHKKRLSLSQSKTLNRRMEMLPVMKQREWNLWIAKWVSLGVGSLAFMMTYKVWPKSEIYSQTYRL